MFGRILALAALVAGVLGAQSGPQFDVASVKPGANCENGSARPGVFPGKLELPCMPLRGLIRMAYGDFFNSGNLVARRIEVIGGPGWLDSEPYAISAKAAGASQADVSGPMLRALLEERFQVKVHREPRDTAVYLLTVAKGGAKLQPAKDGACVPLDLAQLRPPRPQGETQPKFCGAPSMQSGRGGPMLMDAYGMTIAEFAGRFIESQLQRPVIDKTGLTGRFDIHLEFAPDLSGPAFLNGVPAPQAAGDPGGPTIVAALEKQLGLKLTPGRSPVDVIVVDRAEKPSGN